VIIVVPNKDVKELYSKMFAETSVTCFYDFLQSLRDEVLADRPLEKEEKLEKGPAGGREEEK
jgi:hypothetical protein